MKTAIAALLLLPLVGCAQVDVIQVRETCHGDGFTVQLEEMPLESRVTYGVQTCTDWVNIFTRYSEAFYKRWGHRGALKGYTIRVRTTKIEGSDHVGGQTYSDTIDVKFGSEVTLAHEMGHVVHSWGHVNWACTFGPWIRDELGFDQQAYLGSCDDINGDPWFHDHGE